MKKYVVWIRPKDVAMRKYFKLANGKDFGLVEKIEHGERLNRKQANRLLDEFSKAKIKFGDMVFDKQRIRPKEFKAAA